MKKLQQNYTTPEQSMRLLELGLPADSADCYINEICNNRAFQLPDLFSKCTWLSKKKPIPCWSVGRLIEIYCILTNAKEFKMHTIDTLVEEIIYLLNAIKIDGADFSKLEE